MDLIGSPRFCERGQIDTTSLGLCRGGMRG